MILDKIPRIECVLIIPELIEGELDSILLEFKKNKKSLKILKKYKKRIRTFNYIKNILELFDKDEEKNSDEYKIILNLFNNFDIEKFNNVDLFNSLINSLNNSDKILLTSYIINHIDKIINKYIKILIHIDDQTFVISKQNKNNKKIFLKFFLPKIIKDLETGINSFDESLNTDKDNIHVTLLPTVEGHGLDGLFHLTFRIEGKKNIVFEYSKFASLNIDSNKLGVGIYPDINCKKSLIFKIIENLKKLVELIKEKNFTNFNNNILHINNYNSLLEYLSLDILNELSINKKLDYIFEKYFYSLGKETIKNIIDKLFKIVILTFIELYFGLK